MKLIIYAIKHSYWSLKVVEGQGIKQHIAYQGNAVCIKIYINFSETLAKYLHEGGYMHGYLYDRSQKRNTVKLHTYYQNYVQMVLHKTTHLTTQNHRSYYVER